MVSVILPRMVLHRNAKIMIDSFRKSAYQTRGIDKNQPFELTIEPYAGQNPYVRKMMHYLVRHLERDLVGAYLHGSLGTWEEIPYSDFDALVILKNEVFESVARLARVADRLRKATSSCMNSIRCSITAGLC